MIKNLNSQGKEALREMAIPWVPIAVLIAMAQLLESSPQQYHESWVNWIRFLGLPLMMAVAYLATVISGLRYYCPPGTLRTIRDSLFTLFYILAVLGVPLGLPLTLPGFDVMGYTLMAALLGFVITFLLHAYLAGVNRFMTSRVNDRELWEKKKYFQIDFIFVPTAVAIIFTPFLVVAPFLDGTVNYPLLSAVITFFGTVITYFLKKEEELHLHGLSHTSGLTS